MKEVKDYDIVTFSLVCPSVKYLEEEEPSIWKIVGFSVKNIDDIKKGEVLDFTKIDKLTRKYRIMEVYKIDVEDECDVIVRFIKLLKK